MQVHLAEASPDMKSIAAAAISSVDVSLRIKFLLKLGNMLEPSERRALPSRLLALMDPYSTAYGVDVGLRPRPPSAIAALHASHVWKRTPTLS